MCDSFVHFPFLNDVYLFQYIYMNVGIRYIALVEFSEKKNKYNVNLSFIK